MSYINTNQDSKELTVINGFTGDSFISLADGRCKKISELSKSDILLGVKNNIQKEFNYNECIASGGTTNKYLTIWLQDGTIIKTTPTQKFLSEKGEWIEAQNLLNNYITAGLEFPLDKKLSDEEEKWNIVIENPNNIGLASGGLNYILAFGLCSNKSIKDSNGNVIFNLNLTNNKEFTIKLARITGYLSCNKNIYVYFQTKIDALNFYNDIKFIGYELYNKPTIEEGKYKIVIPIELYHLVDSFNSKICSYPSTVIRNYLNGIASYNCIINEKNLFIGYTDIIQNLFNKLELQTVRIGNFLSIDIYTFHKNIGTFYNVNNSYRLTNLHNFGGYIKYDIVEFYDEGITCSYKKVVDIQTIDEQEIFYIIKSDEVDNVIINGVVAYCK